MNFDISDEQQQLHDSVQRLLSARCSFEQRRAAAASGGDTALWQQLAGLGITALPLAEEDGGFGGSASDLSPFLQAFGRVMLLEPYLSTCVLGATALRLAADAPTRQRLLGGVARGDTLLAWAHDEAAARHAPCWIETRATPAAGGWVLDGSKCLVLHAGTAGHFIVSARVSGAADAADGRALFLVGADAPGLQLRRHVLVDDTPAGELTLRAVVAVPLGDPHDSAHASRAIEATINAGIAAVCADMVGSMQAAHDLAMAYLNTRKQFGKLIGENQALRHRAAEMLVSLEVCKSMAMGAAVAVDDPASVDAAADLLRAKLLIGRHARSVCQQAIQLHGGIGMTEEYAVGHYLRRVHVRDHLFGDVDAQSTRLASLLQTA
jgi:alkylation response protein AidB-like acyl-CoA dehydrogenase